MATATRIAPANLLDSDVDEPEGSVPSPFPIFYAQSQPNPAENSVDHASSVAQEHVEPVNTPLPLSRLLNIRRVLQPISFALAEAFRSVAEVQLWAVKALEALLELHLPPAPQGVLEHSPHAASSSSRTTFDYTAELRAITQHLVALAGEPEMEATATPTSSIATISQLVSSLRASMLMSDADMSFVESIVSVLTHASSLVEDPHRHLIQYRGHDPADYHGSLANLRQSLARLLQSSALDTMEKAALESSSLHAVRQSLDSKHLGDASLSLLNDLSRRHHESSAASVRRPSHDSELPPEYEHDPPAYMNSSVEDMPSAAKVRHIQSAPDLGRPLPRSSFTSANTEKDQLDLDNVTLAIERLYAVAPQIRDQRVELNPSKRQELELARIMGTVQRLGTRLDSQRAQGGNLPRSMSEHNLAAASSAKGKGRAEDREDLENLFEMLSGAERPRLAKQRAALSEDVSARLRRIKAARAKEASEREDFVDRIQRGVEKGRLKTQDAAFSSRTRDKSTLLTLPEFIQESRSEPAVASISSDSHLSATTESASLVLSRQDSNTSCSSGLATKRKRSFFSRPRSNSAPAPKLTENANIQRKRGTEPTPEIVRLQYVAEYQANLRNVSVLVTLPQQSAPPSCLFATLAKSFNDERATAIDVRFGPQSSVYSIELPVPVSTLGPNALDMRLVDDRLELKANVAPSWMPSREETPLLDAARLNSMKPADFICSSCSLPLIRCERSGRGPGLLFSDLPSEYWSELVEAWMCHPEQEVSADVVKHGKRGAQGVRPSPTQALVGGSYILVDATSVVEASLRVSTTAKNNMPLNNSVWKALFERGYIRAYTFKNFPRAEWRQLRCICGAALGAQQAEGGKGLPTYRFAKYAIRPVSPHTSYENVPISAYVIADMLEVVQAHASYRFIIRDEENENIRILIWLFNPSVRISHSVLRAFALPKTGCSHAAKVMFKLVGPAETLPVDRLSILYPDFAAADHLFYPLSVCHSLAVMLRNSNIAYPRSSCKIGALDLGWLRRA